jgi:hypothetical protein
MQLSWDCEVVLSCTGQELKLWPGGNEDVIAVSCANWHRVVIIRFPPDLLDVIIRVLPPSDDEIQNNEGIV